MYEMRFPSLQMAVKFLLFGLSITSTILFCAAQARAQRFDFNLQQEMVFHIGSTGGNCTGCNWIVAEGRITADTPERFRDFLAKNSVRGRVHLNSPGGNLAAGLRLGEMIRNEKLDTLVSKTVGQATKFGFIQQDSSAKPEAICASACSFAFMGGVKRNARSSYYKMNLIWTSGAGKIGVHQFYDQNALKDFDRNIYSARDLASTQVLVGVLLEYTKRMGISTDVVRLSSTAGPQDMRWLSDSELVETRMDNGENLSRQEILATSSGSATVNLYHLGELGNYTIRLQCLNRNLLNLRIRLERPLKIGPEEYSEWGIYENFVVSDGKTTLPVKMLSRNVLPTSAGSTTDIALEISGRWTFLTKFGFEDQGLGARWGNLFANDLSFSLANPTPTLRLLYRSCG